MKKMLIVLTILFVIPSVFAINIDVEKQATGQVLIRELNNDVVFNVTIINSGSQDTFEFYNLASFGIQPEKITIGAGETENLEISLTSLGNLPGSSLHTVPVFIRASDDSEVREDFTFRITSLSNAFRLTASEIDPESTEIEITLENLENFDFGEIDAEFSSSFFTFEEEFSMGPKEVKTFTIELNDETSRSLVAGFYTLTADVTVQNKEATVEGTIEFVEKNIVTTTESDFGFFITTQSTSKMNEGNTVEASQTVIKKNIISRLFTTFSPEPDVVERDGIAVYYTWTRDIRPGETLEIVVKTNWLFPLIVILLIVAIVALVRQYSGTSLLLKKKVSFVRAKGGEFALKVSILVNAKKPLERVNVIDRLPSLVNVHERFGGEQPTRIDEKNKRIEWNFESLQPGETRVLSYIIYSKVGIMGKFALPPATAVFEKDGEVHESESNRAFFISEPRKKDAEEE